MRWDLDPGSRATIGVGTQPTLMATSGSSIYVTNFGADTVSVITAATGAVAATVPVGDEPYGIAFDGASMWVANQASGTVSEIDVATNTVVGTPVAVGSGPVGVAFDGTNIYVANAGDDSVSVINPATAAVIATIPVGDQPQSIAFDGTNLYVTNLVDNSVSVIDPTTNTVVGAPIAVGAAPRGIAFDGTFLWVANSSGASVSVINPVDRHRRQHRRERGRSKRCGVRRQVHLRQPVWRWSARCDQPVDVRHLRCARWSRSVRRAVRRHEHLRGQPSGRDGVQAHPVLIVVAPILPADIADDRRDRIGAWR